MKVKKLVASFVFVIAAFASTAHAHSDWVGPFIGGAIIGGMIRPYYPPAYYPPAPVIIIPAPQEPVRQAPTMIYQQRDGTCVVQQHDPYTNRVETYQVPCQRR